MNNEQLTFFATYPAPQAWVLYLIRLGRNTRDEIVQDSPLTSTITDIGLSALLNDRIVHNGPRGLEIDESMLSPIVQSKIREVAAINQQDDGEVYGPAGIASNTNSAINPYGWTDAFLAERVRDLLGKGKSLDAFFASSVSVDRAEALFKAVAEVCLLAFVKEGDKHTLDEMMDSYEWLDASFVMTQYDLTNPDSYWSDHVKRVTYYHDRAIKNPSINAFMGSLLKAHAHSLRSKRAASGAAVKQFDYEPTGDETWE